MLDTRHCRATIIKSEACTPAVAAASVRRFMQQEVEITPDVHRNLNLAIAALEDLEGHRTFELDATVQAEPKPAPHKQVKPQTQTPVTNKARLPCKPAAANTDTGVKSAKSGKDLKRSKNRKAEP